MEQLTKQQSGSLNGKKIVVLGGSAGIGLATAQAAAQDGATIVIASSSQQRIDNALKELPEGSKGYAIDLTNEQQIQSFFAELGEFDHLVYTAGENLQLNTINDTVVPDAIQFFNVRYWGAFTAVKYAAPYINTSGSITLTGGVAGSRPGSGWSLGASICAAMEGFTRAMAVELAPVRVNAVAPGIVKTDLWRNMADADREDMYTHFGNTLPVKFVADADDIAQTYLYLIRQQYSTGQTVVVDGGYSLV